MKKLCGCSSYTLVMDLSMPMMDDNNELDRILENTNLDEFEQLTYTARAIR